MGVDNLVFARIDASANEHPKLQVRDLNKLMCEIYQVAFMSPDIQI